MSWGIVVQEKKITSAVQGKGIRQMREIRRFNTPL
jgi:hypothetical protein